MSVMGSERIETYDQFATMLAVSDPDYWITERGKETTGDGLTATYPVTVPFDVSRRKRTAAIEYQIAPKVVSEQPHDKRLIVVMNRETFNQHTPEIPDDMDVILMNTFPANYIGVAKPGDAPLQRRREIKKSVDEWEGPLNRHERRKRSALDRRAA